MGIKIVCKFDISQDTYLMKHLNNEEFDELISRLDENGTFLLSLLREGDTVYLKFPVVEYGEKRYISWTTVGRTYLLLSDVAEFLNEKGQWLLENIKEIMNYQ